MGRSNREPVVFYQRTSSIGRPTRNRSAIAQSDARFYAFHKKYLFGCAIGKGTRNSDRWITLTVLNP